MKNLLRQHFKRQWLVCFALTFYLLSCQDDKKQEWTMIQINQWH